MIAFLPIFLDSNQSFLTFPWPGKIFFFQTFFPDCGNPGDGGMYTVQFEWGWNERKWRIYVLSVHRQTYKPMDRHTEGQTNSKQATMSHTQKADDKNLLHNLQLNLS